ncbi:MAG: phosphotransferase [Rhodanobacter sp. 68-29]|nr:CehA/McbA family metallohydrolase [Rhodanobacter sp.]ODU73851.1 MAG: phosphotransferase [Rhodanobacter sp. SCN 69-32]OJY57966.1 MAG: phosphotransferase [Rhodanobacter sp. 68-29]
MTLARMRIAALLLLALLALPAFARAGDAGREAPNLVLQGDLDGKDNQTYRMLPFDVPAGTARITVQFDYSGHDSDRTTIDLGMLGPDGFHGQDGFRGWSGGARKLFTIATTDASPGYLPGTIRPGRWQLMLGIPNIRAGSHSHYVAKIWFSAADAPAWEPAVLNPPLRSEAGWYRGDLHMHTAHSDASCPSQSGKRVPCPLFLTVEAAVRRGLDFIAITDHNTVSHAEAMRELQPYFDRLLLIPGREITTFSGHANLWGSTAPVDFRIDGTQVKDWNALLDAVAPLHALVSINHPRLPDGEICMGCGWIAKPPVDMARVQAVEVVNGEDTGTPVTGLPFWTAALADGFRPTAVGGSDNHDATLTASKFGASMVGRPTTVVHADALSMPAILDGIRAGHVFVDVAGSSDRLLECDAQSGNQHAAMGDALQASAGQRVDIHVHATHVAGMRLLALLDEKPLPQGADRVLSGDDAQEDYTWTGDGQRHWLRFEVRDAQGGLLLIGNPIYINPRR